MYLLLFFALVGAGLALAAPGRARGRPRLIWSGAALAAVTVLLFSVLDFSGEVLWFEAVGFEKRLWTFVGWEAATADVATAAAIAVAPLCRVPITAGREAGDRLR